MILNKVLFYHFNNCPFSSNSGQWLSLIPPSLEATSEILLGFGVMVNLGVLTTQRSPLSSVCASRSAHQALP